MPRMPCMGDGELDEKAREASPHAGHAGLTSLALASRRRATRMRSTDLSARQGFRAQ